LRTPEERGLGELAAGMRGDGEFVETLRGDDVREDVESARGRFEVPGRLPARGEAIRWLKAAAAAATALTAAAAAAAASSVADAAAPFVADCSWGMEISGAMAMGAASAGAFGAFVAAASAAASAAALAAAIAAVAAAVASPAKVAEGAAMGAAAMGAAAMGAAVMGEAMAMGVAATGAADIGVAATGAAATGAAAIRGAELMAVHVPTAMALEFTTTLSGCGAGAGACGASPPTSASLSWRRIFLRMVEFHRFLIALSVRPGSNLTILDHLVPKVCTASTMMRSSSSVHSCLHTEGQRWLCHLPSRIPDERPQKNHAAQGESCRTSLGGEIDLGFWGQSPHAAERSQRATHACFEESVQRSRHQLLMAPRAVRHSRLGRCCAVRLRLAQSSHLSRHCLPTRPSK
jgi:hypothetical protein